MKQEKWLLCPVCGNKTRLVAYLRKSIGYLCI